MQYAILLYDDESWLALPPEAMQAHIAPYMAYTQAARAADAFVSGEPLAPSATGKTVRVRDGRTLVEDGPFADTHEQLGGFYVIEAPDLDAALVWAARCPGARNGTVEVRPALEMSAEA